MGFLSPTVSLSMYAAAHIANGIGLLHEPERAAYATFCNRNALLKSTILQLWWIKITENSPLVVTL